MSISLADALEEVDLEAGKTYCCEVAGRYVELRVFAESPKAASPTPIVSRPSATITEDDIRLDPWCELPGPTPIGTLQSVLVEKMPIDIPDIPASEEPA